MNGVKMIQNLDLSTLMENVAEKAQAFYDVSIILFLSLSFIIPPSKTMKFYNFP